MPPRPFLLTLCFPCIFLFIAVFSEFFWLISMYDSLFFVFGSSWSGLRRRRLSQSVLYKAHVGCAHTVAFTSVHFCGFLVQLDWQCLLQARNEGLSVKLIDWEPPRGGKRRRNATLPPRSPPCPLRRHRRPLTRRPLLTSVIFMPPTTLLQATDTACCKKRRQRPSKEVIEVIVVWQSYHF